MNRLPYFSYGDLTDCVMEPLRSHVEIQFLSFKRCYPNREQFYISDKRDHWIDYYTRELYRLGHFEKNSKDYESASYMWDHLPLDSSRNIYQFSREHYGFAHGLTITQQQGSHCDFFLFATHPNNSAINQFYLNKKDLFTEFIKTFYQKLDPVIQDLSHHRFFVPGNAGKYINTAQAFSPRQRECGTLLADGLTTKEIAKVLKLSPRTVEGYINDLKMKCGAKNRAQLTYLLRECL